jgi:hypothetical protein
VKGIDMMDAVTHYGGIDMTDAVTHYGGIDMTETPPNMRQKRNKREIEELEKYNVEPLNKKRRVESASRPIISPKRNKRFLEVEENEQLNGILKIIIKFKCQI